MFENNIPKEVTFIIDTLYSNKFEAYIVGGCVRDLILGRTPKDFDISTSAKPTDIIKIFDTTIPTGIQHGTVTVVVNDIPFEVTTFRGNEIYTNHRQPDSVNFIDNLNDDLKRRDLTINAMAYSNTSGLIDIFGGISDINNRCIRIIGDANSRFIEDALRMLRTIRFSCELDFSIESSTLNAISKNAHLIKSISAFRIYSEFEKSLLSDNSEKFILYHITGLLQYILPDIYTFSNTLNILNTALCYIRNSPKDIDIRLAILFYMFEPKLNNILNKLNLNNKSIKTISTLIAYKNYNFNNSPYNVKILINKIGIPTFLKLLDFLKSINSNVDYTNVYETYNRIILNDEPIFLSDLKITGSDIQKLGINGANIGKVLNKLLIHCYNNPEDNKVSRLMDIAKEIQKQEKEQ